MTMEEDHQSESLLDKGAGTTDPLDELRRDNASEESLSIDAKKKLAREKVRQVVREKGREGCSVKEIVEKTGLARSTVDTHLERLRSLREIYRQKKGGNFYLYYPNGKPLHGVGSEFIECSDGETGIKIQLAQGKEDRLFFHVAEKRHSLLEGETTEGAIVLPLEDFEEVFEKMNKLADEFEEMES